MKSKSFLFLVLFYLIAKSAGQSSCDGNCPKGNCDLCYCGTLQSPQNISYWCDQYSWNKAFCECIITHESAGNANAINYNADDNTYDIGLFQINTLNWGFCNSGNPPCAIENNLNCAIDVYKVGQNSFKLWATYSMCSSAVIGVLSLLNYIVNFI